MAEAVAEKTKIKDDEFDIHGDLAITEADDKSFVVLYDSAKANSAPAAAKHEPDMEVPDLHEMDESHALDAGSAAHPEDAYIDDILSSDDEEIVPAARQAPPLSNESDESEDGPISLSSEELDGILEMGPAAEEEFHPDFPPDTDADNSNSAVTPVEQHGAAHREHPAPVVDEAYEDDELPIALSDEDLDEILLEEEGTESSAAGAEAPVMPAAPIVAPAPKMAAAPAMHDAAPPMQPAPAPADFALSEDEEPIALSDDELDHILADAEAGHAESSPEMAQPLEDEILTLDEDPEITMIDDTSAVLGAGSGSPAADTQGHSADFFDSDEDEPITLSDEELDGILSSAPEEEAAVASDEMALAELPNDGVVEISDDTAMGDDDEPVALSADELDGILMDAEESPVEPAEQGTNTSTALGAGSADERGFFDSDEDEPIALSADELDGIAATAIPEDMDTSTSLRGPETEDGRSAGDAGADDLAELPPDLNADGAADETIPDIAMDERYADVDHMDETPSPAPEDDEGPIALSADELDGIVADAREVTPEAPMIGLGPMDTGPGEPSLADNTDKPATIFEEDLESATLIHEDDQAAAAAEPQPDTAELKSVMTYLDNLLGELPDDVIEKFAQSEYFKMYQKIMDKLGL